MELEGHIKRIGTTKEFGSNGFTKRNLVLETIGDYPQVILLEFHKDNCEKLDGKGIGEHVKVDINLRGKEWTNPQGEVKYFNTLVGWKIESLGAAPEQAAPAPAQTQAAPAPATAPKQEPEDDLPF